MSQRKSERIVNLLIALLITRAPLPKYKIRQVNEGYRDQTDETFERMFERDKDELRQLGVVIHTVETETDYGLEVGYRIDRSEFELPELSFTREEMAVLGAAAHVWQGSVAAEETSDALAALRAAGIDVDVQSAQTLHPQIPADENFAVLRQALLERREARFDYRGEERHIQPWHLHLRRGQWYVRGFDHGRAEPRNFKLSRIQGEAKLGRQAGAFDIPSEDSNFDVGDGPATAVVALREDVASDMRRGAEPIERPVPPGFAAWRVQAATEEILVSEIVALGSGAIALEPAHVRAAVVEHLRQVAGRWPV